MVDRGVKTTGASAGVKRNFEVRKVPNSLEEDLVRVGFRLVRLEGSTENLLALDGRCSTRGSMGLLRVVDELCALCGLAAGGDLELAR